MKKPRTTGRATYPRHKTHVSRLHSSPIGNTPTALLLGFAPCESPTSSPSTGLARPTCRSSYCPVQPLTSFDFFHFNYVAIPTNLPPLIFLIGLFSTSELYICRLSAIRFPVAGKTERFRRGGIHDVASSKGFAFIPRRSTIRRGTWPVFVPFFFPLNISQHPCFLCCLQLGLFCEEDYQIPTFYDAKF